MKVYAFEGSNEVYVSESLAHAEAYFEAIDVENDEYVFFGADGTCISPSVRDGRVALTPMDERRPVELRGRLRTYLEHPQVAMDPALADDLPALADLLFEQEQTRRWPRILGWPRFR
ncbi:hypothetical protein ACQP2Y_12615 [Actinoplanes sp. CA-051413]|uniref:hypothetical protein n=1 Tax=Actinoplanes sp. CA-051413 TaxID=3239899 RepID=UPI003D97155F